jgi:hypothetical protein
VLDMQTSDAALVEITGQSLGGADVSDMARLAESFSVRYATDRDGVYLRVLNESELRAHVDQYFDALMGEVGELASPGLLRRTRRLLMSSNFIQNVLPQDVTVLHGIYGVKLENERPETMQVLLPTPFGSAPVRARSTTRLAGTQAGECLAAEIATVADAESLGRTLGISIARVRGSEKPIRFGDVHLKQTQRILYDAERGLVVRTEMTKEVKVGDRERTDTTTVAIVGFKPGETR